MSLLLALIATGAVATTGPVTFVERVEIDSEIVRLADVADLSGLPPVLRERAAATPVARLRFAEQTLSSRDIVRRARASAPALAAWLPSAADRPIHVRWVRNETPAESPVAAAPAAPAVQAGDRLTVRVNVGPVTVEREVRALQPAAAGAEVFVRTPEGAVLRARLADAQ
jgi:hypothetical protein